MYALDPIMPNGKALSECTFDEVGLTLIRSSLQLGLRAQTKPNGAGVTDEIEHQFLDTKDGEMSK